MIILEDVETPVGLVSSSLVNVDDYERWLSEHPNEAVITTTPMVLIVHQKLPSAE